MIPPISNDKILAASEQKTRLSSREVGSALAGGAAGAMTPTPPVAGLQGGQEPDVGRASRLFAANPQEVGATSGGIQDATQARSLLGQLKAQFNLDPGIATRAMGRADTGQLSVLLQAPA